VERYSEKVMDHFRNPRNVGEIVNPSGVGSAGNPVCGDTMQLHIKVEGDVIIDAKFKTFGCGAAIATSSMVTELIINRRVDEAEEITNKTVADELGGLSQTKMHCSVLAEQALNSAIDDFRKKRNEARQ
jgi:nitrogen fixation protein NifU and related proteins